MQKGGDVKWMKWLWFQRWRTGSRCWAVFLNRQQKDLSFVLARVELAHVNVSAFVHNVDPVVFVLASVPTR